VTDEADIKEVQSQLAEDPKFHKWQAQFQLFIDEVSI
jgi:hypothetical protein